MTAEIHVSHVVTLDVTYLLAELMDFTSEVILGLLLDVTKFIPTV
jgi:hypothetical protein